MGRTVITTLVDGPVEPLRFEDNQRRNMDRRPYGTAVNVFFDCATQHFHAGLSCYVPDGIDEQLVGGQLWHFLSRRRRRHGKAQHGSAG